MSNLKPRFIAFEGPNGAGKSTLIQLLSQALAQQGIPVAVVSQSREGETYSSYYGQLLRFCADRTEMVINRIRPLLDQGFWVLRDRWTPSTRIYQADKICLSPAQAEAVGISISMSTVSLNPDLIVFLDPGKRASDQGLRTAYEEQYFQTARKGLLDRWRVYSTESATEEEVLFDILVDLQDLGYLPFSEDQIPWPLSEHPQ